MKRVSMGILSIMTIMACMVWGSSVSYAFVHPGLLNNRAEYDLMKNKVAAKAEPWYSAYLKVPDYRSYTPQPMADFYVTTSDTADGWIMYNDAKAAYTSAIHWIITGNTQHAEKAKQIVNAWSYKLKSIGGDYQKRLEISWKWYQFMPTAEILKHTYSNWSTTDQQKFTTVLRTLIIPNLQATDIDGSGGNTPRNNWAAFGAMTRMAIGIYLNDQTLFNQAVSDYKQLVNFYIGTFGNPIPTGFTFETCRLGNGSLGTLEGGDVGHVEMALGALVQAAEMGKKQGVDLYGYTDASDKASLLTALVYHAPFIGYPKRGSDATWPCDVALESISTSSIMPWQMPYNHYRHQALKSVSNYVGLQKSAATGAPLDLLTHNYYGSVGSSPALVSMPTNLRVVSAQ
jgi:alginate lyase